MDALSRLTFALESSGLMIEGSLLERAVRSETIPAVSPATRTEPGAGDAGRSSRDRDVPVADYSPGARGWTENCWHMIAGMSQPKLRYIEIKPMKREELEQRLGSDDTAAICDALFAAAQHDSDWRWSRLLQPFR